jgi:hypothetical protein
VAVNKFFLSLDYTNTLSIMKTLFFISALLITTSIHGQLKGMDIYVPVPERTWDVTRMYITSADEYEYIETFDYDNKISKAGLDLTYSELERIFSNNGKKVPKGTIISYNPRIGTSKAGIAKAIQMGERFVMIRYELDDYYVYLNLQDEFCGIAVTKEKID